MPKTVIVNDFFQKGYTYDRIEAPGKNFHPEFRPELTPRQMLSMGIFGGCYMTDCKEEFPEDWFKTARLSPGRKDISLNFYGVDASQPLSIWQEKGWLHPEDPRGWFQWYCRYFMGRRMEMEDLRQIKRWKGIRRHIGAIRKNCGPDQSGCRPRQRQALLHWAYDPRKI
ncbi:hypothetical protein [Desulfospira joergensenii]|uniref:hypothetical protein n=1 Tax=Desulfospira joergensenii TaxID=53329 RepID=UPI0003B52A3D|nr:hypothetical protein [Desulfospira joergensenii]